MHLRTVVQNYYISMPSVGNGHWISSPRSFNKQHNYSSSLVNFNYMKPFLADENALWNASDYGDRERLERENVSFKFHICLRTYI